MMPSERIRLRMDTLRPLIDHDNGYARAMYAGLRLALNDIEVPQAPEAIAPLVLDRAAFLGTAPAEAPAPQSVLMDWSASAAPAAPEKPASPPVSPRMVCTPPKPRRFANETPEQRLARIAAVSAGMKRKHAERREAAALAAAPAPAAPEAPKAPEAPAPAAPALTPLQQAAAYAAVSAGSVESRQEKAREMLAAGADDWQVAQATRLLLREVIRLRAELRDAARAGA